MSVILGAARLHSVIVCANVSETQLATRDANLRRRQQRAFGDLQQCQLLRLIAAAFDVTNNSAASQ